MCMYTADSYLSRKRFNLSTKKHTVGQIKNTFISYNNPITELFILSGNREVYLCFCQIHLSISIRIKSGYMVFLLMRQIKKKKKTTRI